MLTSAHAQTFRGAINGSVTDPSGAVVPKAKVVAENSATAIEHTTVTTSDGQFAFQDLPLGTYKVTTTASGFAVFITGNIAVSAGTIYTLSVKLVLAQSSFRVEVSAADIALDTTTEAQTTTVAGASLQNAPLNGRDFTQLIAVQPGFGGYSAGGFGSLNGTRANQINWQIDGVDNNDLWHNIPAANQGGVSDIAGTVLPIDAIDEFSVQTQSSPEAGRNPGGLVNLVIKSGSNNVHGSTYYYNRNEALAAAPVFLPVDTHKPEMRNVHWGGSVGAPIVKNRTFFFGAFEKQNFTIGIPGLATEPSLAYQQAALGVMDYYHVPENPVSAAMLKILWPSTALQGPAAPNNFYSRDPEYGYSYNGIVKIDHRINDRNYLSFRWFSGEGSQVAPVGSNLKYYYQVAPMHVQNYAFIYNSVFSSRFSNQLLLGVNAFNQVFHDFNNSFETKSFGLYLSPNATFPGAPNLIISGFDQTGLTPPAGRNDITGQATETLSYTVGKHQYRFGGEYRKAQVDEFYNYQALGGFLFDGSQGPWYPDFLNGTGYFKNINTGNFDFNILSLADFMTGGVSRSGMTIGQQDRLVYVNTFTLFFQDAWQVTHKLSVNYGVRYDYFGPLYDRQKDLSTFVPAGGGILFQGAGIPSLYPADWKNFAPRVGFAYSPREKASLVVRAGFGIYYDEPNLNPLLADSPMNGGPNGVEDNPAGANPVSAVEVDNYKIPENTYIFPAAGSTCPTGNGCGNVVYNIFSVNQNFRTAYNYNYNLNLEQGLNGSVLLTLGYVGSEGRRSLTLADINQPSLGDPVSAQGRRPYNSQFPNFGIIDQIESNGASNYNSLQTSLKIKTWRGLTSQYAYTWAHSLDDQTDYRSALPQNSFDLKADYGNSLYDTRHNFTALLSYELPNSSNGPELLLHGWQVSGLFSFHTGQPFPIFTATDSSGTNENVQRPDLIGDPFAGVSHRVVQANGFKFVQWMNPAAFALPAAGAYGAMRRDQIYGPGYADIDLAVFKNFKVNERFTVQFRSEIFNLFNRTNLAPPSPIGFAGPNAQNGFGFSADTIGDYNGAPGIGPGEPLNVQFALKLVF
jgi:Carboxypeptidase regulatory-like domain/TonB dependent receptor